MDVETDHRTVKRFLLICLGGIALLLLVGLYILLRPEHPSDLALIRQFERHRGSFDDAVERVMADPNFVVYGGGQVSRRNRDGNLQGVDASGPPWNGLERAGVMVVWRVERDEASRFVFLMSQGVWGAAETGIEYNDGRLPGSLVERIDLYGPCRGCRLYRRLDDNWYLYARYWD